MKQQKQNNTDTINRMIAKYTQELNKMLAYIGASTIDDFYAHKEDFFKKSFHRADDIISIESSIKKLKASIA
jgi:hypothetical protein